MKKRTKEILDILDAQYGTDARCYLTHDSAWQLLIATILSAQCTDARVNIVTKDLFVKYPSIRAFAEAELKELEQDIHSTGFYHNKAKNIIACCRKLHEEYNYEVPSDIDELHVKRISGKLGLTEEEDPVKVEFDLMKEIPKDHWILINMQLITFGRDICKAQRPECERCRLTKYCGYYKNSRR